MTTSVRLTSGALVGRDVQLRASLTALKTFRSDRPGVVIVSGPAGIGKTRFVTALSDRLRADGATILAGACVDLGTAIPYSPLIEAFRTVEPAPTHILDALTAGVDVPRSRLFALLRDQIVALAQQRLTVLVVEDLQWSDRVTRDVLLYLTATARQGRWALVVSVRDDEIATRPPVRQCVALLHRDALVRASLKALSKRQVAALIEGITGTVPSRQRADRIHRRTGGVPLLVEEVVAAEAAGTTAVPEHLRDLFVARVRGLDRHAGRAVEVVAVVGDRCSDRLVARVLECDRSEAAAALVRADTAHVLIEEVGGFRTRHELLREAVYGAIPPPRRRTLHRRVAQALAVGAAQAAVLAHHWDAAEEPTQAAQASLRAAALAERMHAPAEAHNHLERVLEQFNALPADRAEAAGGRGALLARAAEAAYLGGDFGRAVVLAEASLEEVDDPTLEALRWERLARYRWVHRDGAGAQRAHIRSVATLPHEASAGHRARVLSGHGWNLAITGRTSEARSVSQEALDAAHMSEAPLERCRALLTWGFTRHDEEVGLAVLQRARDLAVACDASDELARAQLAVALSLAQLGCRDEREQALRDGLGHVAAHGLGGSYVPVMGYLLAELLLETSRWDEADRLLGESIERGVSGVPAMFIYAYRALLAAGRGDAAALKAAADQVEELSEDMPQQPLPRAIVWRARAEAALWAGEPATALTHAEQADLPALDAVAHMASLVLQARAVADLSDLARRLGRAPPAMPQTVEAEAGVVSSRHHPRIRALAATMSGELSRHCGDRAAAPWRHAVTYWEAAADLYGAAYCRLRLAYALLDRRTGRREAGMHLQEALRAASLIDARPLLDAVTNLATVAPVHRSVRRGREPPSRARPARDSVGPDASRTGDPAAARGRPDEYRDRRRADHQPTDSGRPRVTDPAEAGSGTTYRSGRHRPTPRASRQLTGDTQAGTEYVIRQTYTTPASPTVGGTDHRRCPMSEPLIMISRATVKPGQRETYQAHLSEAIEMVRREEPAMLGFHNYASGDGTDVSTVQIHASADSLDTHLKLFNERLSERAYQAVDVRQIDVYGEPNPNTREYLETLPERMPGLSVRLLPARAGASSAHDRS